MKIVVSEKQESDSPLRSSEPTIDVVDGYILLPNVIPTITADNGKEFAKHETIAQKLEINFYFCTP